MRRIAIIPARGGSKRLPRKNIADFLGKPIIAWTIEAAIESGMFDRVIVSTEDNEIAEIACDFDAVVDKRNPDLATDTARVIDVCLDLLDREEKAGRAYDVMGCLYATAPLRWAEDIKETLALIEPGICDFSMAATHYGLPVHQALKLSDGGNVTPMFPDLVEKRAADVGEIVVDNGSTYAATVSALRRQKTFHGENVKVHVMPRERSQDIDEAFDLEIARLCAQRADGA